MIILISSTLIIIILGFIPYDIKLIKKKKIKETIMFWWDIGGWFLFGNVS